MDKTFRPSLALVLFLPIAILVMSVGMWQFWLSNSQGRQATSRVTERLREALAARVAASTSDYLDSAGRIVQFNRDFLGQDLAGQPDRRGLARLFLNQIRINPHLTYISFGSNEGWYVGAHRSPLSGQIFLVLCERAGTPLISYRVGPDGTIPFPPGRELEAAVSEGPFDARLRVWYKSAVEHAAGIFWYPVYKYALEDSLGTGVSAVVTDSKGVARGVVSADMALLVLNLFLDENPVGKQGLSLIADKQGQLLAASTVEKPFVLVGNTLVRSAIGDLGLAAANEAWARLQDQSAHGRAGRFSFSHDGESWLVDWVKVLKPGLEDWVILTMLPESDYFEEYDRTARITMWLTVGVLLALGVLVLGLTHRIVTPLRRLKDRAALLANGEAAQFSGVSRIAEIHDLGISLARMESLIQEGQDHLEAALTEHRMRALELQNSATFAAQTSAEIAHEIRTPLSNSSLAASHMETMLENLDVKFRSGTLSRSDMEHFMDSGKEGLSIIRTNLERSNEIARHFQKVMVDQLGERPQVLGLFDHLGEILFALKPVLRHNQIELALSGDATAKVHLDPGLLNHLVGNLVNNAINHGFPPGHMGARRISMEVLREDERVLLVVSDTGRGMDEEERARAFDPLYTTGGSHQGSGLGLAMIKRMVETKGGGTIELHSIRGQGSSFRISFPSAG